MVDPGPVPHVGLPVVLNCHISVTIAGQPAARVSDLCACDGPLDPIVEGSTSVYFGGKLAARMGDPTGHGGVITGGCSTVLIGDTASGSEDGDTGEDAAQVFALRAAATAGLAFCKIC